MLVIQFIRCKLLINVIYLKTFLGSTGGKTDDVETALVKEEPKVEETTPVAETPKESVTVNVEDLEDIW